jgi:hypothetical protein
MASMSRFGLALLLVGPLVTGCSAARPEWLQEEDDACFRTREFTEEIPRMYWGDPARDPCWRYRRGLEDLK